MAHSAAMQLSTEWDPPEARERREALVEQVAREVSDPRVLEAMRAVPRHLFVPYASLAQAYGDHPLEIGHDQTISQPTVVGLMSEALQLTGRERVLEIGTGSAYQAAVLGLLAAEVDSIEIVPELAERARLVLGELGLHNVRVHVGDGWRGLPERGPYDRIVVTAAPEELPRTLVEQLAEGGRLVLPVGSQQSDQRLYVIEKQGGATHRRDLGGVRFVPMVHGPG